MQEERQAAEGTFGRVAEDWLSFKSRHWADESRRKAEYVTRSHLLPKPGQMRVATLQTRDVVPVLRAIAGHAPDLARKARQYVQSIVRHAIINGLRDEGRMLLLDGVLPSAANKSRIPAATLPEEAAALMRAIQAYSTDVIRAALLLCAYTAQRPGGVVSMRREELALETGEWRIPAAKMKTRHTHIVPLPTQAVDVIGSMRAYTAGRDHVFPPLARQGTPHRALSPLRWSGNMATNAVWG